jgi:hypothetical protein
MPATVKKRGSKWRVVEAESGNLVRQDGSPVDGGGHSSKKKAQQQAQAINANR